MSRVLFATIALLSGCVAESAVGLRVHQPSLAGPDEPVCVEEYPTGSNIKRVMCHEPLSAADQFERGLWGHLVRVPPHATDTPGLRVYR